MILRAILLGCFVIRVRRAAGSVNVPATTVFRAGAPQEACRVWGAVEGVPWRVCRGGCAVEGVRWGGGSGGVPAAGCSGWCAVGGVKSEENTCELK